jgi:hypothetical protein
MIVSCEREHNIVPQSQGARSRSQVMIGYTGNLHERRVTTKETSLTISSDLENNANFDCGN